MTTNADRTMRKVTEKLEAGDREVLERIRRVVVALNGGCDPDLEQEVFLRILIAFRRLRDVRSPEGLIRKIARDVIVDAWRSRRHEALKDRDLIANGESPVESTRMEEHMDWERKRRLLRDAILGLSCDIRAPVYLFYVENYPIRTIVRLFGKSPSAVKMALHRGRLQVEKTVGGLSSKAGKKVGDRARSRRSSLQPSENTRSNKWHSR